MRLSIGAGWNQTEADWMRMLRLPGVVALTIDTVSTGLSIQYGGALAWIGMVLTSPQHRGRGLATALMQELLGRLDAASVPTIGLDASSAGQPIYEKLGFVVTHSIERWFRPAPAGPASARGPAQVPSPPASLAELDARMTGLDRSAALLSLAADSCIVYSSGVDGFLMSRDGRLARYLGPGFALDPASLRGLVEAQLAIHSGAAWMWDLFPGHPWTPSLAAEFGFHPVRKLARMRYGKPHPLTDQVKPEMAAIAGFEFG